MIALLLSLAVAAPMQPRQACATRLVATSATLTAGGLALLGTAIAQADQGRPWEPATIGGAVLVGGGLSILVDLAPLVRGRKPTTPQGC